MKGLTKKDALQLFKKIDQELEKIKKKAQVTVLGGLAIILQDFRERSTLDIDIAPTSDAKVFVEICAKLGIQADIINLTTTVDLLNTDTVEQFSGEFLTIDSIKAEDLIKSKLERFKKQDSDDIMAILDKTGISYQYFKKLVKEMMLDFVGNPRSLTLSAQVIVERRYNNNLDDFVSSIK